MIYIISKNGFRFNDKSGDPSALNPCGLRKKTFREMDVVISPTRMGLLGDSWGFQGDIW